MITVVLFRESICEGKLPETPEQDRNVFRIPVGGMPVTSSTSMEDEDVVSGGQEQKADNQSKNKSKPTKRKQHGQKQTEENAAGEKMSSDDSSEELDKLMKE